MDARDEAKRLRDKGYNVIPIRSGTKIPRAGTDEVMKWKKNGCKEEISNVDSIAMLHGPKGGTWAMDLDDPSILDELGDPNSLDMMCIVRTPKQGHHVIFRRVKGDVPEGDIKLIDDGERKIDIKSVGYTLLPPSNHPDVNGRYEWGNDVEPDDMGWRHVHDVLTKIGFHRMGEDSDEAIGQYVKKYDYGTLLGGGFMQGTRRAKLKSLYSQARGNYHMTHAEASKLCHQVNARCKPEPLPTSELNDELGRVKRWHEKTRVTGNATKHVSSGEKKIKVNHVALAKKLCEEFDFVGHVSKEIYWYDEISGIYRRRGDLLIRKKASEYWSESLKLTDHHLTEIVKAIYAKFVEITDDDIFDLQWKMIVLENCVINAETGAKSKHNPNIRATVCHPIKYDADATCPKFDKYLESCFPDDVEQHGAVLEAMAQCFIRKNLTQKGYVFHGIGHNGKSTLADILRNMLGIHNTSSIPMNDLQESKYMGFELHGKSANISADGGKEAINRTTMLKKILGGDALRCEEKFKNPFDYIPYCTMIFIHNELPQINDSSDGFARKIQIVHWEQKFRGKQKDVTMADICEIPEELSGIFNKLLPIMKRIIKSKKLKHEMDVEKTKEIWLKRSDSFYRFQTDCIVEEFGSRCTVKEVQMAYAKMCQDTGMTPLSNGQFAEKMEEWRGHKAAATTVNNLSVRVWKNLRLK